MHIFKTFTDGDDALSVAFTEDLSQIVLPVRVPGGRAPENGDDDEEGVFQFCCKLNKGQPCHTQFDSATI